MLLVNSEQLVIHQVERQKVREIVAIVTDEAPSLEVVQSAVRSQYQRAMNRPPTADEVERMAEFHAGLVKKSGPRIAGELMLVAILMQPEALFRLELGDGQIDSLGRTRLGQDEIAAALSLALGDDWDRELLAAADQEKLGTQAEILAQLDRRLALPLRQNPRIIEFFREYFGLSQVLDVFKDNPRRGRHEPAMLLTDVEILIEEIVSHDRDVLKSLLTTNKYYVGVRRDPKTGEVAIGGDQRPPLEYQLTYGLPADWNWTPNQPIEFRADQRSGVLTHPAWLAAWSGNFDNHPVQRGKWIRNRLLGGQLSDVPIGVDARIPEDEHKQLRERLAMVSSDAACWRCHKLMDPLGLPLEHFDHYGLYRRMEMGRPVDVSGAIAYTGRPEIEGPVKNHVELLHRLASSEYVEQIFVRHVFRFFLGRNETLGDAATLQAAHRAYRDSGGSFKAVVRSLLASESFLYRDAHHPESSLVKQ